MVAARPTPSPADTPERGPAVRALLIGLAALAVLLACFSPRWNVFAAWSRVPEFTGWIEVRRAATFVQQLEHPLAPLSDPIHRVIRWRLLFPVLGHALHLPAGVVLALPFAGAWLALAWLAWLARNAGHTWATAFGFALMFGSAGWLFASTGWLGYFDSWLVLALLAVGYGTPWMVWVACLLGPWVDERFVIALPLALLVRNAALFNAPAMPGERLRTAPATIAAVALTGGYLVVRLALAGRSGSPGVGDYLGAQQALGVAFSRQLFGLWESLRFGWIFVGAGLYALARTAPNNRRVALLVICAATIFVGFGIANDLSRSMVVLVPLAVEGVRRSVRWPRLGAGVTALAAVSVAIPAHHIVTDFVLPISPLPAVARDWRHPVGELAPATWVDRANTLISAGKSDDASRAVSTAVRLDPQYAPAYNARGFIAARQGRWTEAVADFSRACELAPTEGSFWFNLAFAARQRGDQPVFLRALAEAKARSAPGSDTAKKTTELEANRLAP